jgi:NAD(P)-dependent dehydrogenase (short-subunit alcohol dehydrogenase family)
MSTKLLAGQVAIVSGGANGIGRAVAEELLGAGAYVAAFDRLSSVDGRRTDNPWTDTDRPDFDVFTCDVSDAEAVHKLVETVISRRRQIDILVNMAGISRPGGLLQSSIEDLDALLDVNVQGQINLVNAVLPGMVIRNSGQIFLNTSTAGFLGSRRQPAYSAAKEAVIGLSRWLANRLSEKEVIVTALAPTAETRMSAGLIDPYPRSALGLDKTFLDQSAVHIGRLVVGLCALPHRSSGQLLLCGGHYLSDYSQISAGKIIVGAHDLAARGLIPDAVEWVLGRPNLIDMTPWPTRDFSKFSAVRYFEGVSNADPHD